MLRFANIFLIWLVALIPALVVFYWYAFRQKRRAMERFGNLHLMQFLAGSTQRTRQIWKVILLIITTGLMVLAILRPQIGTRLEEVKREGQDIIVALDISASMLAEDIKPNRLTKAKHEIESLIDKLKGDRIGLIAFAGVSFVQCPLTLDYGAAKIFLDIMDSKLAPRSGTAIGEAIRTAIGAFNQKERKYKVLILITDGEDHETEPLKWAEAAQKEGIVIYTVGIGSREGVPIPIGESSGQSGFKKDREGQVIISKLDEVTLEKIALQTNGKYYRASSGEEELDKIYDDIQGMEKKELGTLRFTQFEDRFQFILIIALILLIIEYFLPERNEIKREWKGRFEEISGQ